MPFHWTCPYCDRDTTITNTTESFSSNFTLLNADGYRTISVKTVVCPNPACQRLTLDVLMYELGQKEVPSHSGGSRVVWTIGKLLQEWSLIPPSQAKTFPDYVPKPVRDDYLEACLIRDLSPKASATLSRRCLQGMIRDFWKLSKPRLVEEIAAIKDKVDGTTWKAIDAVRSIGNIGAHMEADINLIVDVDPNEAQTLIGLIELLIKDWYVARQDREERLAAIIKISDEKKAMKDASKPTS